MNLLLEVKLNLAVVRKFYACFAKFNMSVDQRSHGFQRDSLELETFISDFELKAVLLFGLRLYQTCVSGATRL